MDFDALAALLNDRRHLQTEAASKRTQADSHAKNVERLEAEIATLHDKIATLEAKAVRLLTAKE